jgi:hypothetical protein
VVTILATLRRLGGGGAVDNAAEMVERHRKVERITVALDERRPPDPGHRTAA